MTFCTPDIMSCYPLRHFQGITHSWKSVHRISGYQGHLPDITSIINGYQEKNDQISIKYLTDFSITLKNICWIYLNIRHVSVDSSQRVKNLKNHRKQPCFDRIQLPDIRDINRISRPFVHRTSCHPLGNTSNFCQSNERLTIKRGAHRYVDVRLFLKDGHKKKKNTMGS